MTCDNDHDRFDDCRSGHGHYGQENPRNAVLCYRDYYNLTGLCLELTPFILKSNKSN